MVIPAFRRRVTLGNLSHAMSAKDGIPMQGNRFPRLNGGGGLLPDLSHPKGLLGRYAGRAEAECREHIHRGAVDTLGVLPDDDVLEVGFGAGRAIRHLSMRAPQGSVAGIDISEAMLSEALSLNRPAVEQGRVDLRTGCVSRLPWDDGSFDKILDVDCFQFWPDQLENLKEIRRVLKDGGRVLLCLRRETPLDGSLQTPGFNDEELDTARRLIWDAGFAVINEQHCPDCPEVCCLIAEK